MPFSGKLQSAMSPFVALLALVLGDALAAPARSPSISSHRVPKNSVYHFAEARGETLLSVLERSDHHLRGMQSSGPQSDSPSSPAINSLSRLDARRAMEDDVLEPIEYQPMQYTSYTLSLSVFLIDTSELLDDQSREAFELAALNFIAQGLEQTDEIPIDSISDIAVVNQKLTWSRLVDGRSATGVQVYFDAEATVSDDVDKQELQSDLQLLFNKNDRAFRRHFNLALRGEPARDEDAGSIIEELKPIQVPLGLSLIAAGCIGFVAVAAACTRHGTRKESGKSEDVKEMSKTSIVEVNDNTVQQRADYPVQQATGKRVSYDSSDSEDVLTFDDNSFNASLVFCPSVVKVQQDVRGMFDCDESAIANIDDATDSDEDDTYSYSPVRRAQKPLTPDALRAFDDEVRRAEC